MHHTLRIAAGALRTLATADRAARVNTIPVGLNRGPASDEWLIADLRGVAARHAAVEARAIVAVRDTPEEWEPLLAQLLQTTHSGVSMAMVIGRGPALGQLLAACRSTAGIAPFESLTIVGAGLPRFDMATRPVSIAELDRIRAGQPREAAARARWSRTIGALGHQQWRHLRRQHALIVGCGRSGSMVAASLARGGVRRLTLVDPDVVEPHNLGETDVVQAVDLGRAKVAAIAATLSEEVDVEIHGVATGIERLSAFRLARSADVLIGCADDPVARLLTSAIGVAYLRPVLDIGTGVFGEGALRRVGMDVRLLLPGVCLVCCGGVTGLDRRAASEEGPAAVTTDEDDWRRQRAGSLRSVNQIAVGLGLRLIEDLVAGRIGTTTWLHVDFTADGIPALERIRPRADAGCPICALAGCGDALLPFMPRLVDDALDFMRRATLTQRP